LLASSDALPREEYAVEMLSCRGAEIRLAFNDWRAAQKAVTLVLSITAVKSKTMLYCTS